jgi:telomerase reverse transcriptase
VQELTFRQISNVPWLAARNTCASMSQSDTRKSWALFYELIYYLFDSVLIPLIQANFYVTESNVHRYRLFFFRHDVWRSLSEPTLASLKLTTLEEMQTDEAQKLLRSRPIGFSQLRLLPKEAGVRPIANLKRRTVRKGYNNVLGSSINSVLAPVYNMFTYEMVSLLCL